MRRSPLLGGWLKRVCFAGNWIRLFLRQFDIDGDIDFLADQHAACF